MYGHRYLGAVLAIAVVMGVSSAFAQSADKAPRILLMHATDLLAPSTQNGSLE
jgi:hypothetical protein